MHSRAPLFRVAIITGAFAILVVAQSCGYTRHAPLVPSGITATHFAPAMALSFYAKLGWKNFMSPLYTDEQRFNTQADDYGPIARIAPSDTLGAWTNITDFDVPDGRLVAGVTVYDTLAITPPLPTPYTDLGLSSGNNCIYLAHSGASWTAYVAPENTGGGAACPPAHPGAVALTVVPISNATYPTASDVPAVARFHEGTKALLKDRALMGVRCANMWCLLLPVGITPDQVFYNSTGRPKQWAVRGWQDIQHLGEMQSSGLKISSYEAAVVPAAGIGTFTKGADYDTGWVAVATVQFKKNPNSSSYGSKWEFRDSNVVYIRTDASSPTGWIGEVRNRRKHWWGSSYIARFPLSVRRIPHEDDGIVVPAIARFHWKDKDEWIWVRCDVGCCEVAPDGASFE